MKKKRGWIIVVVVLLIAGVVFDQMAAVKPQLPSLREGDPDPKRPAEGDVPFAQEPIAATFAERRQIYFDWILEQTTPDDRGGVWVDIGKLAAGAQSINPIALQAALDFVNQREDPSDFAMTSLIRLYYLYQGSGKLSTEQEAALRDAILNWCYWLDEPNPTLVQMWTENHQILNHSIEYLAGQLFPDEIFTNNGKSGRWHMEHAEGLIRQWIDLRARTGFAEWDSETYYPEDLGALFNLVDFADDTEIATLSTMLVDVILFDIAVDSFYGHFATSHGRVTPASIKTAGGTVTTLNALVWGQGRITSAGNMAVIGLVTSPKYQIPPVIEALALDNPEVYRNYERDSFPIADAALYGLDINDVNDMPLFWGMGAFTQPEIIAHTIHTADVWNLWHYDEFKDLKSIAKVLQKINALPLASRLLDPDTNGMLMSEVNKVTYRTPDAMLSSAQDFRKGEKGYQQHIWQATLSPYAVVFATNPDSMRTDDKQRPSYWMSNGRLPRSGQVDNVLIALHDIDRYPSAPKPLETRHYAFTHAYFPKWAFDEVREAAAESGGGWIFGRVGEGYVALYSHLPYQWTSSGVDAEQEVIALGRRNVWICQVGRAAVDGSFEEFVAGISNAKLEVKGLQVRFDSPGNGMLQFDWDGDLNLDGVVVPLDGYPRWENPYTNMEFDSQKLRIVYNEHSLELDFANVTRVMK
ncbi:MAG: hypothetical protein CVU39_08665 [Chloroflexi bacterium HGW-Chloroflexi-10]|nr:MAG: hypothetical protein CVU39_08665 [Chloroflexi bacterium HGW-Chloroflexi-10]